MKAMRRNFFVKSVPLINQSGMTDDEVVTLRPVWIKWEREYETDGWSIRHYVGEQNENREVDVTSIIVSV